MVGIINISTRKPKATEALGMMKVAKLACLGPHIVTAIVEGRQPLKLTSGKLLAIDLPLAWGDQKQALGFG